MLASSEGLHRDMEVTATGAGIKTPVGEQTLGRLFNVLGEAIDGGAQPDTEESDFSTLCIWGKEVDDLDTCLENFLCRVLLLNLYRSRRAFQRGK